MAHRAEPGRGGRRPWPATQRCGGDIDHVLDRLRGIDGSLVVARAVTEDETGEPVDDHVWFVGDGEAGPEVRIDTHAGGDAPFLLDGGPERWAETGDTDYAATLVAEWLGLDADGGTDADDGDDDWDGE